MDEDVYRSVVRGRLMEDDFIEEDNGVSGYADHGMDEWDRSGSEKDEDEDMDGADASAFSLPARRDPLHWLQLTLFLAHLSLSFRTPQRGEKAR